MLGFEMNGRGNHEFKWYGEAWSEGDLWLVRGALYATPNSLGKGGGAASSGLIEDGFKKIKDALFTNVAHLGLNMHLTVTGSFNFQYYFKTSKAGDHTATDLLKIIDYQQNNMRDQVMLHFCKCILAFRTHVIYRDQNNLSLKIDIAL